MHNYSTLYCCMQGLPENQPYRTEEFTRLKYYTFIYLTISMSPIWHRVELSGHSEVSSKRALKLYVQSVQQRC